MEWVSVVLPMVSAVLGATVGGLVVHRLALLREVVGDRRAQRIGHLINAYRVLVDAANRDAPLTSEQSRPFEAAMSDIMLLGEADEVGAATHFMDVMASGRKADLHKLIVALRLSLRSELGLSKMNMPIQYILRFTSAPTQQSVRQTPLASADMDVHSGDPTSGTR